MVSPLRSCSAAAATMMMLSGSARSIRWRRRRARVLLLAVMGVVSLGRLAQAFLAQQQGGDAHEFAQFGKRLLLFLVVGFRVGACARDLLEQPQRLV